MNDFAATSTLQNEAEQHAPISNFTEVDEDFKAYLVANGPEIAQRLISYRDADICFDGNAISRFIVDAAPLVESFIANLFNLKNSLQLAQERISEENKIASFKAAFVARAARRADGPKDLEGFERLTSWLTREIHELDPKGQLNELSVADYGCRLLKDTQSNSESIDRLTRWCKLAKSTTDGMTLVKDWSSFRLPEIIQHENLVPLETEENGSHSRLRCSPEIIRPRDGFSLTETTPSSIEARLESAYCRYCHEHETDFCSSGFHENPRNRTGHFKTNPLGVTLSGCPLEEHISQMNLLYQKGHFLAAFAVAMINNPMLAATGHRICTDCMQSCIYQKKTPVNIPLVESRIVTEVLALERGAEIYDLLCRWNPLRREQYLPKSDNGYRVLVVGMGPAGFSMAHHLTMEGCTVIGIDALKIEPLPQELLHTQIDSWEASCESLDERLIMGFGGVMEYGITSRWNKNLLKLIYMSLARRDNFSVTGGVRFGGTLTIEDVWNLGFDHICMATGSGYTRVIALENNLAKGIRKASDFLMTLQLTGAARRTSLVCLDVRLPSVIVGGGLTAIDTATEVQAYYIRQVEKCFDKFDKLRAAGHWEAFFSRLDPESKETLLTFIRHGKLVVREREQAARDHREVNFIPLIRRWGGVTIVYRKTLRESPAYATNHDEVRKAMEEGIHFVENLVPLNASLDQYGLVESVTFSHRRHGAKESEPPPPLSMPARSVFIAAGTEPNTIYEAEHPGTFELSGNNFQPHLLDDRGNLVPVTQVSASGKGGSGSFTSYRADHHYITFLGDCHPAYNGSVVKAIASSRNTYPEVLRALRTRKSSTLFGTPAMFVDRVEALLSARIISVSRLGNGDVVEIWIHAPMAARNFRPGQFYRLQSFESGSRTFKGSRLSISGITVSGAGVENDRIRLLVLQWGVGPRLASRLKPGEPVVLMGPNGKPSEIPHNQDILIVAGRWGEAVMLDLGPALRQAGNRILLFLASGGAEDIVHQSELEESTDQIVWCTATEPRVTIRRPGDVSLVETNMVKAITHYAEAVAPTVETGDAIDLAQIDRIMVMGGTGLLSGMQAALDGVLKPLFREDVQAIGTVGSPMQCMMKGVCGQCLQWQIDPATGRRTRAVYSCSQQEQPLSWIDLSHLSHRQGMNRASDMLHARWLDHLLSGQS